MESVYDRNEKSAAEFNKSLTERGIFCVNIMGSPGAGKTSVLVKIIEKLGLPAYVIEGDIESDIDSRKLKSLGISAVQINTGGACHLDAPVVSDAFSELEPDGVNLNRGFLFIENIGNLVCPAEFVIGEHIKLLISSAAEGSDKPYKYPLAFEKADIILLNKCDLLDYIDFDREFFMSGVKKLNPSALVFTVSGKTGQGIDEAAAWLKNRSNPVINIIK